MLNRSLPGPATAPDPARFWDRTARQYAADPIADPAGYEATLRRVQALLTPHDTVLEIGCGTGTTALRLAPRTAGLLATDVSPGMIAIAREKLAQAPQPRLRFEVADDVAAPRHGTAHDAVLAFNLLHLVPDLDATLDAVCRALRPGGLFLSKTPCLAEMNPLVPHLLVPLMRALGKAPAVQVFGADQLQSALARHGLRVEATERHGTRRKDFRVFIVARKAP
jgi:ubiquinone/menaquinone biosynthesis C-methylase UbiE